MAIASRRQTTKIRPSATNFARHSLRITNSAAIAYWRLRPVPSGVAEELIGEGMNGTFSAVTFPKGRHSPAGLHCPLFDGSTSTIDIYSTALNTLLTPAEMSVSVWVKVDSESIWTDSTKRVIIRISADGSNYLDISKATGDNVITFAYSGGGTADSVAADALVTGLDRYWDSEAKVTWMHVGFSISDTLDQMKCYLDGIQTGATQTGIGTWSGALDSDATLLGSTALASPADVWSGQISDLILWNGILGADEMLKLFRVP